MGILIAILIAVLMYIIMNKTTLGYQLKACGANRHAAQINDGGDDDIGDVFVVGGEVCNLQTGDIQCGHEAPSEPWAIS